MYNKPKIGGTLEHLSFVVNTVPSGELLFRLPVLRSRRETGSDLMPIA
jgi:hypothetical protein